MTFFDNSEIYIKWCLSRAQGNVLQIGLGYALKELFDFVKFGKTTIFHPNMLSESVWSHFSPLEAIKGSRYCQYWYPTWQNTQTISDIIYWQNHWFAIWHIYFLKSGLKHPVPPPPVYNAVDIINCPPPPIYNADEFFFLPVLWSRDQPLTTNTLHLWSKTAL